MPSMLPSSVFSMRAISRSSFPDQGTSSFVGARIRASAVGMRGIISGEPATRRALITNRTVHQRGAAKRPRCPKTEPCAASARAHQTRAIALPVPVLFGGPLVVLLLALREPDAQLGAALRPVQV